MGTCDSLDRSDCKERVGDPAPHKKEILMTDSAESQAEPTETEVPHITEVTPSLAHAIDDGQLGLW